MRNIQPFQVGLFPKWYFGVDCSVNDPEPPVVRHVVDSVVAGLVQPAVGPSHSGTVFHLADNKIQQELEIRFVSSGHTF